MASRRFLTLHSSSSPTQVRQDLHSFGYRPDLSRRSPESRINMEEQGIRTIAESVARDIRERENESPSNDHPPSTYTRVAIPSFHFFAHAFNASESVAEYVLAKCAIAWDECIPELIVSTLKNIYRVSNDRWTGADQTWHAAMMVRVQHDITCFFLFPSLTGHYLFSCRTDLSNTCSDTRQTPGSAYSYDFDVRREVSSE